MSTVVNIRDHFQAAEVDTGRRSWLGAFRDRMRLANLRRREQRMAAMLDCMSDRLLQDIGICRSEIPYVAREWSGR